MRAGDIGKNYGERGEAMDSGLEAGQRREVKEVLRRRGELRARG